MKGLILKDLYNMKKYMKQYLLFFLVFGIMSITMKMPSYIGFLGFFFAMSVFISSFSTDEFFHWETYALAMPLSKRELVKGKYLLLLLLFGVAVIFGFGGGIVICLTANLELIENMAAIGALFVVIMFMMSILIPVIYKTGSDKARLYMILIFAIPAILIFAANSFSGGDRLMNFLNSISWNFVFVGAGIASIFALILSYFVSIKIIENKEF